MATTRRQRRRVIDKSYDFANSQWDFDAYPTAYGTFVVEGRLVASFHGDGHEADAERWIDAQVPPNPEE